jgi:sulfotransferase
MNNGIHFISGLPRSGSTLLAGILRQNPRFHAGMTSPAGAMYAALMGAMSRRNETAIFIEDEQRRNVLKGLFTSYYSGIHENRLIFDTNRAWTARLPALAQMFPAARVICCVRDISWIMDSIERLVRRNAFELSGMFEFKGDTNVFSRVGRLAAPDGLVGHALDNLKQAFWSEEAADRLILIEYEQLANDPTRTMAAVYAALDEEPFKHDFDNVEYAADGFDMALGAPGLHTVRRKVELIKRDSILPPELFWRFELDVFWRRPKANTHHVPIIAA